MKNQGNKVHLTIESSYGMRKRIRNNREYFEANATIDGKTTFGVGKSERDARQKLKTKIENRKSTLNQNDRHLATIWFESWLKNEVMLENNPNRYYDHEKNFRIHIKPHITGLYLHEIDRLLVINIIGSVKGSASLKNQVKCTMNKCLESALLSNFITINPVAQKIRIKNDKNNALTKDKIPTKEQVEKLLQIARREVPIYGDMNNSRANLNKKNRYNNGCTYFVLVMLFGSGLRIGEALALRWSDINFKAGCLNVERSVKAMRNHDSENDSNVTEKGCHNSENDRRKVKLLIGGTKTIASDRFAHLPEWCIKPLKEWRNLEKMKTKQLFIEEAVHQKRSGERKFPKMQVSEAFIKQLLAIDQSKWERLIDDYIDGNMAEQLVFTNSEGGTIDPKNLRRCLKRLRLKLYEQQQIDIRNFTFHKARHYFVTACLGSGIPIDLVSRTVGHSDIRVTNGIYCHTTSQEASKQIKLFADRFVLDVNSKGKESQTNAV